MTMFEWAALGAVMFAVLIFCARIMRRGLTTLDDHRRENLEKIRLGQKKLDEDSKNIPALDHLRVMKAALEDLLRLDGNPEGHCVETIDHGLELRVPDGCWRIELLMKEKSLRSTRRVVHGKSRWLLSGFGHYEQHIDPASLMKSLNSHLHALASDDMPEPEHLARRLGGIGAIAHRP